jgi:hypothetical protein
MDVDHLDAIGPDAGFVRPAAPRGRINVLVEELFFVEKAAGRSDYPSGPAG